MLCDAILAWKFVFVFAILVGLIGAGASMAWIIPAPPDDIEE